MSRRIVALFCLCCLSLPAWAHKPSDSYLMLAVHGDRVEGQWDIALRDLDAAIGLDADGNGELTWGEVRRRQEAIGAYALARLALGSAGRSCPARIRPLQIDRHTDGAYAVLTFDARCGGAITRLDVDYRLLFEIDPQHRGLLRLRQPDGTVETAIFSPDRMHQQFAANTSSRLSQFGDYLRTGIWHIWIGFDHILFLLSLLLPSVLERRDGHWRGVTAWRSAVADVFKIVTAFTLAHSLTLTLATVQWVSLPSRWVESAIAASVVLAALNNVFPVLGPRRWVAAFLFGLVHGFGFASVLTDLGLPRGALALALVGFNVGVEVGQLTLVAVFMPVAYLVRDRWIYRRAALTGGSFVIAAVAAVWLVERAFNLSFGWFGA